MSLLALGTESRLYILLYRRVSTTGDCNRVFLLSFHLFAFVSLFCFCFTFLPSVSLSCFCFTVLLSFHCFRFIVLLSFHCFRFIVLLSFRNITGGERKPASSGRQLDGRYPAEGKDITVSFKYVILVGTRNTVTYYYLLLSFIITAS
jgi:hypothetical protein